MKRRESRWDASFATTPRQKEAKPPKTSRRKHGEFAQLIWDELVREPLHTNASLSVTLGANPSAVRTTCERLELKLRFDQGHKYNWIDKDLAKLRDLVLANASVPAIYGAFGVDRGTLVRGLIELVKERA